MTNNRYQHFKNFEDCAKRFDEQIEMALRQYRSILTHFLDENEQEVFKRVCGNRCTYKMSGGYEGSEKVRILMNGKEDELFDIIHLKAKLSRYDHLTHRDCLGALMNLGCRKDAFGDIIVTEDAIHVFVSESIAQSVINECQKIRHSKVQFARCKIPFEKQIKLEWKETIVTSMRLDCVVAAMTHLSRSKSADLIRAGKVQVQHLPLEDCSFVCNNNEVISIRGFGRFLLEGTIKHTRKDRILIRYAIYK